MTVGFHPAAEEEFRAAASYYEDRIAGLGEELILEIERTCGLLEEYPDLGPRLDPVLRRHVLRRFPFALIYRVDGSVLRIIALAHESRRPGYWRPRS